MDRVDSAIAKIEANFDSVTTQIQAQYRDTNLSNLIKGIIDIQKKYVLNAFKSLVLYNLSLNSAKGDGLDLWGLLLGFHRYVLIDEISGLYYNLSDSEYRTILMCIYQKSFINANIDSVNTFANSILSSFAEVTVQDTTDMSYQIFTFNKRLPEWLKFCLENKDVLPRPACVGLKISETTYSWFGFAPDDSYKETNPDAYNARVEWFKTNIGNFDTAIFRDITSYEDYQKRLKWFKEHIGNFDNSIFENIDSGELIFGFAPERE